MERYLSVSRAARLAGVSRGEIQRRIRAGDLETFEGEVSVSALQSVYPQVRPEEDRVLERVSRLQINAVHKMPLDDLPREAVLIEQIERLRRQLDDERAEKEYYKGVVVNLKDRMVELQEGCDRQQRAMLQALVNWMLRKLEQGS
jgi:CDP-4-dehydro-6-deoxyglucose reductase